MKPNVKLPKKLNKEYTKAMRDYNRIHHARSMLAREEERQVPVSLKRSAAKKLRKLLPKLRPVSMWHTGMTLYSLGLITDEPNQSLEYLLETASVFKTLGNHR